MKRFLGLTQEEITENQELWKEENGGKLKPVLDSGAQMRSAGITPAGIQQDVADQTAEAPTEAPPAGAEPEAAPAEPAA